MLLIPLAGLSLAFSAVIPAYAQTATVSPLCYAFSNNLGEGRYISPVDAQALTVALTNAGIWNQGTPITTYDEMVASAVSGFQEKYAAQILAPNGLSYGTGYVGTSTRAELNTLYGGCSNPAQPAQPTQCPTGYICTPINQNPVTVCPSGYICTPAASTPPSVSPSSGAVSASVTLDAASPLTSQTNQATAVPVLTFDLSPQNGIAALTGITVNIATSGTGSVTTAYLYANNTLLGTAPVQNGAAHFTGVFSQMAANTYQPFMVKIDTTNANGLVIAASVDTDSGYGIVNAGGVNVNLTGSAIGNPTMIGGVPGSPIVSPTSSASAASASLTLDPASPLSGQTVLTSSVPVLTFDVMTQSGTATLNGATVQIGSNGGSVSTAYLYQGSTEIASVPVQNGVAQFSNLPASALSSSTWYPFTVKVDISNSNSNMAFSASVTGAGLSLLDQNGSAISVSGSASGSTITAGTQ